MPICAVSVDLDEIPNYAAIHGIRAESVDLNAVYDRAVPRLFEWAHKQQIPLTLFTIASDLRREAPKRRLLEAIERGHEVGNHSLDHRYDLTRLGSDEIRDQVRGAQQLFAEHLGVTPTGFRAPGYTVSDPLYEVLSEEGLRYSSSVFPCPAYYLAKAGAIAAKGIVGKRSASVVDDPRVLTAPTRPYRVGRPYWKRGQGLIEVPIQTTPGLRLPFIGTALTLAGPRVSRWLAQQVSQVPLVNLELHGIDLLDEFDDLRGLAQVQPDLRVPLKTKLQALSAAITTLKAAGHRFVTLNSAVNELF
ncbi:MAG: hypothetical protein RJA70_275 [Pseudomonadota bacterium]|jgi:peptidoglycan/xylan/chitin deacetylase (PgdA/CDA1 family)